MDPDEATIVKCQIGSYVAFACGQLKESVQYLIDSFGLCAVLVNPALACGHKGE